MARTKVKVPKKIGKGLAHITKIEEILNSIVDDLAAINTAFAAHVHATATTPTVTTIDIATIKES